MYVPKYHEETDLSVIHAFIRKHPLGAWVTYADGVPIANHIPFYLNPMKGKYGTLEGHVARANPVWKSLSDGVESIVLFQGADAYITPSWYPGKRTHGKVVPTWNYVVVHAHGTPRLIEDRAWLREHLELLTNEQEAGAEEPWRVSDPPQDYTEGLMGAIVGVEIPISKLVGKWKVSQNRSGPERLGVIAGLKARGGTHAQEMAELVRQYGPDDDAGSTHK